MKKRIKIQTKVRCENCGYDKTERIVKDGKVYQVCPCCNAQLGGVKTVKENA